jgi:hypothetical protein
MLRKQAISVRALRMGKDFGSYKRKSIKEEHSKGRA